MRKNCYILRVQVRSHQKKQKQTNPKVKQQNRHVQSYPSYWPPPQLHISPYTEAILGSTAAHRGDSSSSSTMLASSRAHNITDHYSKLLMSKQNKQFFFFFLMLIGHIAHLFSCTSVHTTFGRKWNEQIRSSQAENILTYKNLTKTSEEEEKKKKKGL